MCGLVGMAGNLGMKQEKAFKTMLVLDSLRGVDSTGVAMIHNGLHYETSVVKQLGNPYELLDMASYTKADNKPSRCRIGHNRFATQGIVSKRNAHPFEFDHVIGAHNGTLENKHVLDNAHTFAVDSEALYNHIDKIGLEEAITNLRGAWALTWWDSHDDSINFLRNKERPLFLCENKTGDVIYWASEAWMLRVALSRHEIEHTEPHMLKEDLHYSVKLSPLGMFTEENEKEVKSNAPVVSHYRGGAAWHNNYGAQQVQTAPPVAPRPAVSAPTPSSVAAEAAARATQQAIANAVSNVVNIPEKKTDSEIGNLVGWAAYYGGSKARMLQVVAAHKDDRVGASYLSCVDEEYPDAQIRMYYHPRGADNNLVGKAIVADIRAKPFLSGTGVVYFKVEYSTVRKPVETPEEEATYATHEGKQLSENEWRDKYKYCCWCSGNVFPTDEVEFTKGGEVICQDCKFIPEIKHYT